MASSSRANRQQAKPTGSGNKTCPSEEMLGSLQPKILSAITPGHVRIIVIIRIY